MGVSLVNSKDFSAIPLRPLWQLPCFYSQFAVMNSQFLNKFWFCIRVSFINSHSLTFSSWGLMLEGDSGEEVTLWRLNSLSRWSKVKFKSPCNFEELPYVADCIFSLLVIYLWKCRYRAHVYWNLSYLFWKWFSWKVIHYGL